MADKILFVDDEPNVLQSIKRGLRKRYSVDTAESGKDALYALEHDGPYAVIVTDMQMPQMNGTELLSLAKQKWPDTVRMMLTGNADQQTAIDAINHGDILRFLNKPADVDQISDALEAALSQHRLITAEQELLRKTLHGSVNALADTLALSNPEIFGRSIRLKNRMIDVAVALKRDDSWQLETIALLSQIGCISLPTELVKRVIAGGKINSEERRQYSAHAQAGADLIGTIPRLETVAEAIRYQEKYYDGSGFPEDEIEGDSIPIGARIMRVIMDMDTLESSGVSMMDALARLNQYRHLYDSDILNALGSTQSETELLEIVRVEISKLVEDMKIAADVVTKNGVLLVANGQSTSMSVRRHLINYRDNGQIEPAISVWQPVSSAKAA